MKKIVTMFILAVIALFALVGCGAGTEAAAGSGAVGMANPWTDAETAAEAAQAAGVGGFTLPEDGSATPTGGQLNWFGFRGMKDLAEADGGVGAAVLTVRKGAKTIGEDVSGDYSSYAHSWTQQVGERSVACFGNEEGRTMKALWSDGDFRYSLTVRGQGDEYELYGVDAATLEALVAAVA